MFRKLWSFLCDLGLVTKACIRYPLSSVLIDFENRTLTPITDEVITELARKQIDKWLKDNDPTPGA